MNRISEFEEKINEELQLFCKQLQSDPAGLYDPIKYTLSSPAKRIRPILVLIGSDLFEAPIERAMHAASGIELFHNFTLIHDDLMDNAPLRRNRPTVHEKWDKNVSVLSGDAILIKAVELIAKTDSPNLHKIIEEFTTTAIQVCEGQQLDMSYEKIYKISAAAYINMIELKTAILLAGSLKIGALIADAQPEDAQYLHEFGKNIGIAFQLQDDILDVYGDEKKFGKQKGGDIIANKKTFLLVKAMELANGYVAEELNNWIFAETVDAQHKIEAVTNIYNNLNIQDLAKNEMQKYYEKAVVNLQQISVNMDKKQELISFTDKLIKREK